MRKYWNPYDIKKVKIDTYDLNLFSFDFNMDPINLKDLLLLGDNEWQIKWKKMDISSNSENHIGKYKSKDHKNK